MVSFFVHGIPKTKGSSKSFPHPKTGKIITANDCKREKAWAKDVAFQAKLHVLRSLTSPMDGPVYLELSFYLPKPKRPRHPVFPLTKPDLDKLTRSIKDALKKGGVYLDDSLVCVSTQRKFYALNPRDVGVSIVARELEKSDGATD